MRGSFGFLLLLLVAVAAAGCTTKSKARMQAHEAFLAGQMRAIERMQAQQMPPPAARNTVTILGPVKYPALRWTPDLTLVKTIVAAEYIPPGEPGQIIITRGNQQIPISPATLLGGDDVPVFSGDVVELRP
jgi:hypothetical protein